MAVHEVRQLEDRLVITRQSRHVGGAPYTETIEVPYDSIPDLPLLPQGEEGTETEISVRGRNQTIVLVEYPRKIAGCMYSPYKVFLKPQTKTSSTTPKSTEEIEWPRRTSPAAIPFIKALAKPDHPIDGPKRYIG